MSRPHPGLMDLAAGRSLPPIIDLDALERSAHEHRMMGLLWSSMLNHEISVSAEQLQRLAVYDLSSRAIQKQNWKGLRDVVSRLEVIDVEVATFKGVTAEARWYDRIGERLSSDVDVLVDPGAIGRAREIVDALHPGHPILPYIADLVKRGMVETVALTVGDGVMVDVHFALLEIGLPLRRAG